MAGEYSKLKKAGSLPADFIVLLGHNSGKEISISQPRVIRLSLDWVMARVVNGDLDSIIPCEIQSIDSTSNYQANWHAYSTEQEITPDSKHGMNWANVWKRLIPQLIMKGAIAATSKLCKYGHYFIVPDQVYQRFERLVGDVQEASIPGEGVMTVMTYVLGPEVPYGSIRSIEQCRTKRMN